MAYSSQGSHTGQLDFYNGLPDYYYASSNILMLNFLIRFDSSQSSSYPVVLTMVAWIPFQTVSSFKIVVVSGTKPRPVDY